MDREILLRQLVQVEQGVAEGKAFIAEQQRLIVELERDDCHDTAETMRLLEAFLVLQRSREEDRARISTSYLSKRPTALIRPLWVIADGRALDLWYRRSRRARRRCRSNRRQRHQNGRAVSYLLAKPAAGLEVVRQLRGVHARLALTLRRDRPIQFPRSGVRHFRA